MSTGLRRCTSCREVLPLEAFYKSLQYLQSICKSCCKAQKSFARQKRESAREWEIRWNRLIYASCETVVDLDDARSNNETYYFTGMPCKQGNFAKRLVRSKVCTCKDCSDARGLIQAKARQKCRDKNRQKYNTRANKYRAANRDEINRRRAERTKQGKIDGTLPLSSTLEYKRSQYYRNQEKYNQKKANWRRRNRDKCLAQFHRYRARKLAALVDNVTAEQIEQMSIEQERKCFYCPKDITVDRTIDHVVPLSRGGKHELSNLVLACRACNSSKGSKLLSEWHRGADAIVKINKPS